VKIKSKTLGISDVKPISGYKFKVGFYVKNNIIYLDTGTLELCNLHAALRHIFPDETFDQVAIQANSAMGWGHDGYKFNIYTHKGRVMKPYPVFERHVPWLDLNRRGCFVPWQGGNESELYEFRIFEKQ
jgi:hypothetical protein